jgi:hypothetical protein
VRSFDELRACEKFMKSRANDKNLPLPLFSKEGNPESRQTDSRHLHTKTPLCFRDHPPLKKGDNRGIWIFSQTLRTGSELGRKVNGVFQQC